MSQEVASRKTNAPSELASLEIKESIKSKKILPIVNPTTVSVAKAVKKDTTPVKT